MLCVQWKTPDDGQRNCPKHVQFYSKNKFEKSVHLVGFIIRIHTEHSTLNISHEVVRICSLIKHIRPPTIWGLQQAPHSHFRWPKINYVVFRNTSLYFRPWTNVSWSTGRNTHWITTQWSIILGFISWRVCITHLISYLPLRNHSLTASRIKQPQRNSGGHIALCIMGPNTSDNHRTKGL